MRNHFPSFQVLAGVDDFRDLGQVMGWGLKCCSRWHEKMMESTRNKSGNVNKKKSINFPGKLIFLDLTEEYLILEYLKNSGTFFYWNHFSD